MTQSLRERIKSYFLRHNDRFINGGDIERLALGAGFKASNASRRCRELWEEDFLEKEIKCVAPSKTKTVWYKLKNGIIKLHEKTYTEDIKSSIMGTVQTINTKTLW